MGGGGGQRHSGDAAPHLPPLRPGGHRCRPPPAPTQPPPVRAPGPAALRTQADEEGEAPAPSRPPRQSRQPRRGQSRPAPGPAPRRPHPVGARLWRRHGRERRRRRSPGRRGEEPELASATPRPARAAEPGAPRFPGWEGGSLRHSRENTGASCPHCGATDTLCEMKLKGEKTTPGNKRHKCSVRDSCLAVAERHSWHQSFPLCLYLPHGPGMGVALFCLSTFASNQGRLGLT